MIKRPSEKQTFFFDWASLIISLHFRQQISDINLYFSSPGDFVTVGHVSDIYDIFDIFCLFCDILTYSLSEGAECLESHFQVIRNPWTNFCEKCQTNVNECPVLVVLWKFLIYSLLKGLFWEPRWPRHKISELYSVKFQKIGKYCPVLWTFFITTLSEGPKNFLGVQVLRDKNPWTVFCANSDNYQWWKVLWNVVISLKSFEKLRKVSKSVEKF